MRSVASQTFSDLVWTVVNDGGERAKVDAVAHRAGERGIEVEVVHNPRSLGMEAASNAGIAASKSKYIAFHDDDDTWEPAFLERVVGFMEGPHHPSTRGVATLVTRVEEKVAGEDIREIGREPFRADLRSITLFEMAGRNPVPNISLLYERALHDELGPYREDLPVLGDWEFYLRLLRRHDLAVIREYLASYHVRPAGAGAHGNTITDQDDLHHEVAARIRNEMLRRDLDEGKLGMGLLVNLSPVLESIRRLFRNLARVEGAVRGLPPPARKLISTIRRAVRP